jgi:hypothetical protein
LKKFHFLKMHNNDSSHPNDENRWKKKFCEDSPHQGSGSALWGSAVFPNILLVTDPLRVRPMDSEVNE